MSRVVGRVSDGRPHPGRRAERAVQARVADHLDDRRDAAPGFADEVGQGSVQLDLRARVGAVAELVLQALEVDLVTGAVGQDPRHEEAGHAGLGLGQHQEHVAHGRGAEPLVPGQLVLALDAR